MNLYLVTCIARTEWVESSITLYVVGDDPTDASIKALDLIRQLRYSYDIVTKTELLASVNTHKADKMLVL